MPLPVDNPEPLKRDKLAADLAELVDSIQNTIDRVAYAPIPIEAEREVPTLNVTDVLIRLALARDAIVQAGRGLAAKYPAQLPALELPSFDSLVESAGVRL